MSKVDLNRTYNPTTGELTKLVSSLLDKVRILGLTENPVVTELPWSDCILIGSNTSNDLSLHFQSPEADWKGVRATLMEKNPTWKIPERRVAKFVKRHRSNNGKDDASIASGVSFRRYFSERSAQRKTSESTRQLISDQSEATNDDASTTSARSLRRYFKERSGRKTAKRAEASRRSDANVVQVGGRTSDDEASVNSKGSFRRFLSRESAARQRRKTSKSTSENGENNQSPFVSSRAASGPSLANASMPGQPTTGSVGQIDDDMSVSSMSSVRRFFKERKARRLVRKMARNEKNMFTGTPNGGIPTESGLVESENIPSVEKTVVDQDVEKNHVNQASAATTPTDVSPEKDASTGAMSRDSEVLPVDNTDSRPAVKEDAETTAKTTEGFVEATNKSSMAITAKESTHQTYEEAYLEDKESMKESTPCEGCILL